MKDYDNWLVAPYEQMERESDQYYQWCEDHDFDPDDMDAELEYEAWLQDQYEGWLEEDDEYGEDYYEA